eukprot:1161046-Pelagomonas_calceolata.AAC.11
MVGLHKDTRTPSARAAQAFLSSLPRSLHPFDPWLTAAVRRTREILACNPEHDTRLTARCARYLVSACNWFYVKACTGRLQKRVLTCAALKVMTSTHLKCMEQPVKQLSKQVLLKPPIEVLM